MAIPNRTLDGPHGFAKSRINSWSPTISTISTAIKRCDYNKVRRILTSYRHLLLTYDPEHGTVLGFFLRNRYGCTPFAKQKIQEFILELLPSAIEAFHPSRFDQIPVAIPSLLSLGTPDSTVVHIAARSGRIDILNWIWDHTNTEEFLALCISPSPPALAAVETLQSDSFEWFRSHGSSPTVTNDIGQNGIHIALRQAEHIFHPTFLPMLPSFIRRLLGLGVDPISPDKNGVTPLHLACRNFSLEIVEMIFSPVAIGMLDSLNQSLLHYAASNPRTEVMKFLIAHGGKPFVTAPTIQGQLPLHYACRAEHRGMIKLLITPETINAQDIDGKTPLSVVSERGYFVELSPILIRKGARLDIPNKMGRTPLHNTYRLSPNIVSLIRYSILHAGAVSTYRAIGLPDAEGNTPLSLSVKHRCRRHELIHLLQLGGHDLNQVNSESKELLDLLDEFVPRPDLSFILYAIGCRSDRFNPTPVPTSSEILQIRSEIYFEVSLFQQLLTWMED